MPVRIFVVAAVFITAGIFDLGTVKPFDLVKATTLLFFGWLAFGAWIAEVIRRRTRARRFTMAYAAGIFLLVNTIGAVFSSTRYTSLFGWFGRYNGLIEIVVLVLIFYVVACVYRERRDRLHELIYAMSAASIVVNLYILMQRAGLDPITWAQPSGGVPGQPYFGTMGNANFAGGYLGLTAPCVYFAWHRFRQRWQRALTVTWGVALLSALWFTSARNGMFALGAAILVFLFVHRDRVPLVMKLGFAAATLVAVVLAVVVIWHPGSSTPPEALRRVDVLRSKTIRVRVAWWQAGLRMFRERPVLGWGPETYVTHYAKYVAPESAKLGDSETADKPHNVFVEHLAHTGLLGFGAYLALVAVAFRRGLRRLRDAPADRTIGATLLALLAAYLGQAFFSIDVIAIALIGWVTLGAIAAWADPPDDADARPPRRQAVPTARRALAVAAVIAGVLLATVSTFPLKAEHEAKTATRLGQAAPEGEVLSHFRRASDWNPWEPLLHGLAGDYLENRAASSEDEDEKRDLLARAVEEYRTMDSLQPGYHLWKYSLGKALGDLAAVGGASFADAERWLDEARELAPYDWRIVTAQADLMNTWAVTTRDKEDEAPALLCRGLTFAEDAVRLRRTQGRTQLALGRTLARLGHLDEAVQPLERAGREQGTERLAERILKEVERLRERPKSKRPPVVEC